MKISEGMNQTHPADLAVNFSQNQAPPVYLENSKSMSNGVTMKEEHGKL